jgi:hypothetical protein
MKYEELKKAGSRFLLVPSLSHTMSSHPLKYVDSLVYGCLIYRSRKSKRERVAGISKRLGIDRSTVQASLEKLVHLGCVQHHTDGYEAVEPQGVCRELFTWKKKPQSSWQSQFSYDRTYLPTKESGLTTIQNGLYWRLVSLAVPVDGGCGHLMIGPGARVQSVSNEYLARGLRCSRKTVAAGLDVLQAQAMIHVRFGKTRRRFNVGIHPVGQHVGKWRARERQAREELSFEDLFGQATNSPARPDIIYRPHVFSLLRQEGIPSETTEEIMSLVHGYVIPDSEIKKVLHRVKKDHSRNRSKNPNLPDHCGRLLIAEIKKRGEAGEWRMYDGLASKPMSLPQMQTLEFLNSVNACSEALQLLLKASRDGFVELATGGRLPVTFCWDQVRDIAHAASGNFTMFRDGVAEFLFPSANKPECGWLDSWNECGVVQPIGKWPNDLIPLPEKGRGFVNTVQKWAKEIVELDDVTAADATNEFMRWVQTVQDTTWTQDPDTNMMLVLQCFQGWAQKASGVGVIDQFFYE